jgi:hypothetical protein
MLNPFSLKPGDTIEIDSLLGLKSETVNGLSAEVVDVIIVTLRERAPDFCLECDLKRKLWTLVADGKRYPAKIHRRI